MRRLALVLVLLVVPTLLIAQDRDDRWREGDRDRDRYGRRYDAPRRNTFEITPFAAYRWGGTLFEDRTGLFGQDVDVASSAALGLNFGIPIGDTPLKLELMINRQDTYLTSGGGLFEPDTRIADFDITQYHAGLQIPFGDAYAAQPFVVFSAGVANLDPQVAGVSPENRFSASAGVGLKVPINRNVALRVETRGYFTSLGTDEDDDCGFRCDDEFGHDLYQGEVSLGLSIGF
jgi:hypothetical protein